MKLTGLQSDIFLQRYAATGETEWDHCAKRVAKTIAGIEINGLAKEWGDKFFDTISSGDFMPGGRILFGANRRQFNMLNCYRLHPEDTVESIGKTVQDTYLISCGGGGIGFNFSDLRPKGDDIQNIRWSAPGSVSVMKMINEIGYHVKSGKNRRTALIAILNVDHPDLLEFLTVKLDQNELNNFNISVGITNEFINAVKKNKAWTFKFNGRAYKPYTMRRATEYEGGVIERDTIQVLALDENDALGRAQQHHQLNYTSKFSRVKESEIKARDIWDTLIVNSWKSGDPGIYNLDLCNNFTNVSYFEDVNSPNPCGEIPLPPYGNCCLGHVNLSNMYDDKKNDVNWKRLASSVRVGIRFLDNVLTANHYPIPECKTVGERSRRIGLGVTGLHYLLLKLGHRYGDERCLEFLDRLFATFRNEAYKASIELAKEKGSFPAFDAEKYLQEEFAKQLPPRIQNAIRKHGIRNAVMLTIAPCGTNSMVLGVSSGVEPIFAPVYERTFREGNVQRTENVADALFTEFYGNNADMDHFVGAYDISVEQHLQVQATIQKYIDSAISKTTNLPANFKVEDLSEIILEHASYVKGFTIYRSGSKGNEPLKPVDISSESKLRKAMENAGVDVKSLEACRSGSCEM
jgi:ribonucleoside-diphosphate reductase alpha chain